MKNSLKNKIKRDQILFSAISIINHNGYENTTMEDISNELKMTKGSLYYYFKNKNDLMYHCHMLALSLAAKDLKEVIEGGYPVELTLRKMVAIHIEYAIEEKEIFNKLFDPMNKLEKEQLTPVFSLRKKYSSLFDEIIQRGIEEKVFHLEDPILVRLIILGALNWVQQWYKPNGKLSKAELIEKYGDYILKLVK